MNWKVQKKATKNSFNHIILIPLEFCFWTSLVYMLLSYTNVWLFLSLLRGLGTKDGLPKVTRDFLKSYTCLADS